MWRLLQSATSRALNPLPHQSPEAGSIQEAPTGNQTKARRPQLVLHWGGVGCFSPLATTPSPSLPFLHPEPSLMPTLSQLYQNPKPTLSQPGPYELLPLPPSALLHGRLTFLKRCLEPSVRKRMTAEVGFGGPFFGRFCCKHLGVGPKLGGPLSGSFYM